MVLCSVRDPREHPHVRLVIRASHEPFPLAWDVLHIHAKTSMVCIVIGLEKDTGIHPAIAGTLDFHQGRARR